MEPRAGRFLFNPLTFMHPAIRVENLSKHYRLGERHQGYKTLRETIAGAAAAPLKRLWPGDRGQETGDSGRKSSDFWALKDVSFEVQPGEVVGIIGRNGAGKSTLLKILSRITEPTSGKIELRGRVGSLLEVGTGFHPELTGRENIYMNGSILGMSQREISRKFDEIVDFAEIEEFLDTPVKRYSSGMYVRLAFSVAAHLEPEVLIVDEVLAVGDQAFQAKCLKKMDNVRQHGRTILFVSHNMVAVQGLCSRGIMLTQGRISTVGTAAEAVADYHRHLHTIKQSNGHRFAGSGNVTVRHPEVDITEVRVVSDGESSDVGYPIGSPLEFHFEGVSSSTINSPVFSFRIARLAGPHITTLHSRRSGAELPNAIRGPFSVCCSISELLLPAGDYTLQVGIKSGTKWIHVVEEAAIFSVLPTDFFRTGMNPVASDEAVICRQEWTCDSAQPTHF